MFARPPSRGEAGELCTLDDVAVSDFQKALGRPVILAEFLSELCDPSQPSLGLSCQEHGGR